MDYTLAIQDAAANPEGLEMLYRQAQQKRQESEFANAVQGLYAGSPADPLLAAWHYRLAPATVETPARPSNWLLAVLLGALAGLALFALSDSRLSISRNDLPALFFFWAPVTAAFILAFLVAVTRKLRPAAWIWLALAALSVGVLLLYLNITGYMQDYYLVIAATHLPVLAWVGMGFYLLGWRAGDRNRFAFLSKSFEAVITGGLFLAGGLLLAGITTGLFASLGINFPEWLMRLAATGGAGLVALLAVVTVYDPQVPPEEQDFTSGLSRILAILMRLLLPLSLLVLLAYTIAIPFHFLEPFQNRDVLIIYNVLLFAIMGLLIGITPVSAQGLSERTARLLRIGLMALAGLAVLVSLYALSATVYRTILGGFTMNRIVIVGWNVINISLLVALTVGLVKGGRERWLDALHGVTKPAAIAYTAWALFALLITPLIFPG